MPDEQPPGDALDWTPQQVLRNALKDFDDLPFWKHRDDLEPPSKCFIIMLNDDKGYHTRWYNGGMSISEIVALLEIMKIRILGEMKTQLDDDPESTN